MRLDLLTSPEAGDRADAGAVLAVPVGSTEQHGPHLPLGTDTDIAVELCARLAAARPDVVVGAPLCYGASGEHEGFAGTVSIGNEALELLVVELCRSATRTFPGVVLVSAHGGNHVALARAARRLRREGRRVLVWSAAWPGDAHAGRTETSLQLAIDAGSVRLGRAEAGERRPIGALMATLRTRGVRAVSPNGVLGDPAGASGEEGVELLRTMAAELVEQCAAWLVEQGGPGGPHR
ncbi:MAG TPA: mycofactocin biosynthesis peptidyl-dipeptidase MftE [Acidimicrobiales bacterium]|nr:mycofactocin biosynthesis peptidyl-dipeptidase MftE [Acidimicrobiales bacterium]